MASAARHDGLCARWLSPDPIAGSILNPQSLNRYAYVLNNPTNFIDPLGLGCSDPNDGIPCVRGETTTITVTAQAPNWISFYLWSISNLSRSISNSTPPGSRTRVGGGGAVGGPGTEEVVEKIAENFETVRDEVLGESLRQPGEDVGACVARVRNELLGAKLTLALDTVTGFTFSATAVTQPVGSGVSYVGKKIGNLVEIEAVPGKSAADIAFKAAASEQHAISAETSLSLKAGARTVSKIVAPIFAVSAGIQLGFAPACR